MYLFAPIYICLQLSLVGLSRFRIPKHKRFQILLSGLLLVFAFRFLGMTSMADFVIEGQIA